MSSSTSLTQTRSNLPAPEMPRVNVVSAVALLVPVLLGGGVGLFDHLGTGPIDLERTRVIEGAGVTHLTFRVVK